MTIFETIKNKSFQDFKNIINDSNINEQDRFGRTPLNYAIVQKAPIEFFSELIKKGADISIKDKSGYNIIDKAIRLKNISVIKILLESGTYKDDYTNIFESLWYKLADNSEIRDLINMPKEAFRMKLKEDEKSKLDELIYLEIDDQIKKVEKITSPTFLYNYVQSYNWDDGVTIMIKIIEKESCNVVIAKEIFDLGECEYYIKNFNPEYEEEIKYMELAKMILEKYPEIKNYIIKGLCD